MPSAVAPSPTGVVAGAEVSADALGRVSGFVAGLGDAAPVMVGGVPYGVESLVAAVLSSVLSASAAVTDGAPELVVLAHADGLDEYRVGLWREAARLVGLAVTATVTVPTATALATLEGYGLSALAGDEVAAGASLVRLATDTDPVPAAPVGVVDVAAGATAAGVVALGGVLASGVGTAGEAVAAAAAPVVGPAGAPLVTPGPTGAPLTAGPTGAPLPTAGPTGASLPTAGPTGAPLPTAGPAGAPLSPPVAGPAGTNLTAAGAAPKASKFAGKFFASKAAVIGTTVAVVAVGTVAVVVATRDDSSKPALGAVTTVSPGPGTTVRTTGVSSPGTTTVGATTVPGSSVPTTGTGAAGAVDLTPAIGSWRQACEPYLAGDGASGQIDEITSPGPNQLEVVMSGYDYTTVDCSDASTADIVITFHLNVLGAKTVDGIQVFKTSEVSKPDCVATPQDACSLALSMGVGPRGFNGFGIDSDGQLRIPPTGGPVDADGFPTQFIPLLPGAAKL
jgi:hypothetical protein